MSLEISLFLIYKDIQKEIGADVGKSDQKRNDQAILEGTRIFSAYSLKMGAKLG